MPESTEAGPLQARRRQLIYGGVGLAAAVAGAAFAWRQFSPQAVLPGVNSSLWGMSFDTPAGGTLALQSLRGKPLLVNFWATWCPPCVEELPLIDRFYKENSSKKWQVIGLAIDQPSAVRNFLGKTPVSFPVGLAGLGGTELTKNLGNLTGSLPFTVVLDSRGQVAQRKIGRIVQEDLRRWAELT